MNSSLTDWPPKVKFIDLVVAKCTFCSTIFDFTGDNNGNKIRVEEIQQLEAKSTKREYLIDLINLFDQETHSDKSDKPKPEK